MQHVFAADYSQHGAQAQGSGRFTRVAGVDQRDLRNFLKHSIFSPDEYIYRFFQSEKKRRQ
eukprot:GSA25T00001254001.1